MQVTSVEGFAWGSVVVGGQPLDVSNEFDRRLAEGCAIACRLRGGVKQQLGAPACAGLRCAVLEHAGGVPAAVLPMQQGWLWTPC